MLFLRGLLEPLATFLHVPTDGIVFVTLLLVGIVGHYSIYRVVKSLTVAADRTDTRWDDVVLYACLLYTSPSPRDATLSRMPSSA